MGIGRNSDTKLAMRMKLAAQSIQVYESTPVKYHYYKNKMKRKEGRKGRKDGKERKKRRKRNERVFLIINSYVKRAANLPIIVQSLTDDLKRIVTQYNKFEVKIPKDYRGMFLFISFLPAFLPSFLCYLSY